MTIQMLRQWNGLEAGSIQTLTSGEETRLITAGLARAYTRGMDGISDPVSGGVFFPLTADVQGIRDAAARARAYGGGIVQIPPVQISVTAADVADGPCFSFSGGVRYRGMAPRGANGDDPVYISGTRFVGPGSGICFGSNVTPRDGVAGRPGAYASGTAMHSNAVVGCGCEDMYIEVFDFGIQVGAFQEAGPAYSSFKNLYLRNNNKWGMWLENFSHIDVDTISVYANGIGAGTGRASGGGVCLATSTPRALYNFGNSIVKSLIGGGNNVGYRLHVYNGADMNAVQHFNIQVGGYTNSGTTHAATMTSGNANIGVPDLSVYQIDMPVRTGSSTNGFTSPRTYFVTAMSGSSGAGTIQLSERMGGNTVVTPSASNAINLETRGMGAVYIGGPEAGGNYVTWGSMSGASDIEVGGVARFILQGVRGGFYETGIVGAGTGYAGVCLRDFDQYAQLRSGSAIDIDSDLPYNHIGALAGWLYRSPGIATVQTNGGNGALYINGAQAVSTDANVFGKVKVAAHFCSHTGITNGYTFAGSESNFVTYRDDSAGGGFTLQSSVTSNMVGLWFEITNATANTVTMNYNATATTQIIGNGAAPANSYVIPAWTTVRVKLIDKNGTRYWAVQT